VDRGVEGREKFEERMGMERFEGRMGESVGKYFRDCSEIWLSPEQKCDTHTCQTHHRKNPVRTHQSKTTQKKTFRPFHHEKWLLLRVNQTTKDLQASVFRRWREKTAPIEKKTKKTEIQEKTTSERLYVESFRRQEEQRRTLREPALIFLKPPPRKGPPKKISRVGNKSDINKNSAFFFLEHVGSHSHWFRHLFFALFSEFS